MSIKSDKWINRMAAEHGMIDPFEPRQVRYVDGNKVISFGTSSYGYDVRCAREFKIFTNVHTSNVVDPKNFDESSFVSIEEDYCIIPPNSFPIFWQGKVFDRKAGTLVNKILGLFRDVPARVFVGDSWFDGKPSILIDYRETSWLCRPVRDEIRMVAPNLYLGFAYVRTPGRPVTPLMFALDFNRRPS